LCAQNGIQDEFEGKRVQCPKCGHEFVAIHLIGWPWRFLDSYFEKAVAQQSLPGGYALLTQQLDNKPDISELSPDDPDVIAAQGEAEVGFWALNRQEFPLHIIKSFENEMMKSKHYARFAKAYEEGQPPDWKEKWEIVKSNIPKLPVGRTLTCLEDSAVGSLTYEAGPKILELTIRKPGGTTGTFTIQRGQLLKAPEAAKYLGYTLRHLYRMINSGEITPSGVIGRYKFFDKGYLKYWKRENKKHSLKLTGRKVEEFPESEKSGK
jgi:hypothetical protein